MGITWTHLESVWNPSGPSGHSEVPYSTNWSETIFCRFLQQTGSNIGGYTNVISFRFGLQKFFCLTFFCKNATILVHVRRPSRLSQNSIGSSQSIDGYVLLQLLKAKNLCNGIAHLVKVSKSQKQVFLFSFEPKN